MLNSVRSQSYPNWELCIVDDASNLSHINQILENARKNDSRIKFCTNNTRQHISKTTNNAINMATGDFLAFLDHDDQLAEDALKKISQCIELQPDIDFIYSDENLVDERGNHGPAHPKPAWSPDHLLSNMYTCHLSIYRRSLVQGQGCFRDGFEGSQDYDLILRLSEKTLKTCHIPYLLYHWHCAPDSVALNPENKKYAYDAGKKALQDALERRKEFGSIVHREGYPGHYKVFYRSKTPKISIFLYGHSDYDANQYFSELKLWYGNKIELLYSNTLPDNYSISQAKGNILFFIDRMMKPVNRQYIGQIALHAQKKHVGAVSGTWVGKNDTVLHSGVYLGVEGIWRYSHYGFERGNPGFFGRLLDMTNYLAVGQECFAVSKEKFFAVNGFSEKIQTCKVIDLCLKLYEKGMYNLVVPWLEFICYHEEKLEFVRYTVEDCFIDRWQTLIENDPYYSPALCKKRIFQPQNIPDNHQNFRFREHLNA